MAGYDRSAPYGEAVRACSTKGKPSLSSGRESKSYFSSQRGGRSVSACQQRVEERFRRRASGALDSASQHKSIVSMKSHKTSKSAKSGRAKSGGQRHFKKHTVSSNNKRAAKFDRSAQGKSQGDISRKSSLSKTSRRQKSVESRRMRQRHLNTLRNNALINQDIEESLGRDGTGASGDGSQEFFDTQGKANKKVDFSLHSEDEKSPQFQQSSMLGDLGAGIQVEGEEAHTSVHDSYNPDLGNHTATINFGDYAEIKEEPNEESTKQETEQDERKRLSSHLPTITAP